jgi:hypothetical protein
MFFNLFGTKHCANAPAIHTHNSRKTGNDSIAKGLFGNINHKLA